MRIDEFIAELDQKEKEAIKGENEIINYDDDSSYYDSFDINAHVNQLQELLDINHINGDVMLYSRNNESVIEVSVFGLQRIEYLAHYIRSVTPMDICLDVRNVY